MAKSTSALTVWMLTSSRQKVKDRLANKVDKRVFIKSDARARYGNVVEVVDNVRSAGVDDVGLLTEQKKSGAASDKRRPPAAK